MTNHYYVCEITDIPEKIYHLVVWRLKNGQNKIKDVIDKVIHGEI